MRQKHIPAVVLAAGRSSRMGQPKQLLRYCGESMLRRAVSIALAADCDPVVVVLGADFELVRKELSGTLARVVVNQNWADGMSSSIRCGISAVDQITNREANAALLMLCDQPWVDTDAIRQLARCYQERAAPVVASKYESNGAAVFGVPAIFARELFIELKSLDGTAGAKSVIMRHQDQAAFVAQSGAAFDIDTFADYLSLTSISQFER